MKSLKLLVINIAKCIEKAKAEAKSKPAEEKKEQAAEIPKSPGIKINSQVRKRKNRNKA